MYSFYCSEVVKQWQTCCLYEIEKKHNEAWIKKIVSRIELKWLETDCFFIIDSGSKIAIAVDLASGEKVYSEGGREGWSRSDHVSGKMEKFFHNSQKIK